MIQDLVEEWWKKWYCQVFPNLVPAYRWQHKARELMKGDIVLMYDQNEVKGKYKLGRVAEVIPSRTDNIVRRAIVQYKNVKVDSDLKRAAKGLDLKKLKMKETERPIQSLVVIVPSKERSSCT